MSDFEVVEDDGPLSVPGVEHPSDDKKGLPCDANCSESQTCRDRKTGVL